MTGLNKRDTFKKIILVFYLTVAIIEITAELISCKLLIFVFKPLIPAMLMVLYWSISSRRDYFFFGIMLLSLITDVFFIPNTEGMLFMGLISFFGHRLLMIYYLFKLIKIKDCIPLLIGMIPFLFLFFYLQSISSEITMRTYYIVMVQNVLISILGGIALSHYMMYHNKKDTWLFIFGLLSVTQYFIVFIEKYYLFGLSPIIFRPLAMILNTGVYFAFYKFVIVIEKSNESSSL